jgi:hypothetical protein
MNVKAILKVKNDAQQVSDNFTKREFVATIDATTPYPQNVQFQLSNAKCSLLDNINVGDNIDISFNLRGREWQNPQGEVKYFNTIDAWKITKLNSGDNNSTPQNNTSQSDDDLPF